MPDGMAMTVQGDKALERALASLGVKVVKKHLRKILNAEAKPLVADAKQTVKTSLAGSTDSTGLLAKSIGRKVVAFGQERTKTPKGFRFTGAAKGMEVHIGPRRGTGRLVLDPKANTQKERFLSAKRSRLVKKATTRKQRKSFGMVFREPTRYAHLVERGKRGKKIVAAIPFMRTAYRRGVQTAIPGVIRRLWQVVRMEATASART